jgi:hypothetical protein
VHVHEVLVRVQRAEAARRVHHVAVFGGAEAVPPRLRVVEAAALTIDVRAGVERREIRVHALARQLQHVHAETAAERRQQQRQHDHGGRQPRRHAA